MYYAILGKCRGAQDAAERIALLVAQSAVLIQRVISFAQMRMAGVAIGSTAARPQQRDHDVVAHFCCGDIFAYFFDNARSFVARYHRWLGAPFASDYVNITMADGCSDDPDFDLAWMGWFNIDVFNDEGFAELVTDCCFHGDTSCQRL